MATEAGDAACIHQTGREIVALHAVLVRRAICKMCEGGLAKLVILKLPEIVEVEAHLKPDRPIVIFSVDRIVEGLALRVTLNTGVARMDVVEAGRIHDGFPDRLGGMSAARPVATLAPD